MHHFVNRHRDTDTAGGLDDESRPTGTTQVSWASWSEDEVHACLSFGSLDGLLKAESGYLDVVKFE